MSRLRTMMAPTVIGLVAAAGVAAPALAAGVRDTGPSLSMPSFASPAMPNFGLPDTGSFFPGQDGSSFKCLFFAYNLGPLGPLGPYGPLGPLHDKPHPECWGAVPQLDGNHN